MYRTRNHKKSQLNINVSYTTFTHVPNIPWTGHTSLGFSLEYIDKGKFSELSKLGNWANEADHLSFIE